MSSTGTGTPGADIEAVDAWNKTTGSNDVVVAVLDSVVDYRASDLAPNIVNEWDVVTSISDLMDRYFHGTGVAGIIAAAGNSGIGVKGVMWKAKIMPVRVTNVLNVGKYSDVVDGIYYANSHGASIINMYFGGHEYSQALKNAIDSSPALCICAAMNDGRNNDQTLIYPALYNSSNIISVAATDQNDALASFSNYDPTSVQVAAPGTNIVSTYPQHTLLFNDPQQLYGVGCTGTVAHYKRSEWQPSDQRND